MALFFRHSTLALSFYNKIPSFFGSCENSGINAIPLEMTALGLHQSYEESRPLGQSCRCLIDGLHPSVFGSTLQLSVVIFRGTGERLPPPPQLMPSTVVAMGVDISKYQKKE